MSDEQNLKLDWRTPPLAGIRDGFGRGLLAIGERERLLVLTADLAGSTRVEKFEEAYPSKFVEVGVAEQNMAGVAAGLALEGYVPYMSSFAVFSPGRNWDQIRVSVALTNTNVKIISSHGGLATGIVGPSHQALEDIALMRVLPNMTVLVPADASQCAAAVESSYSYQGPVYIRATRPDTPDFTKEGAFEVGKVYKYREGKDLTIAVCGIQVWECLMVAEDLAKQGLECEILNVSTVKPLDMITILESVRKTRRVVTVEDHQIAGGMGSAIAELLSEKLPTPILRIGINDRFGVSGEYEEVYSYMGSDRINLREAIRHFVLD